MVAMLAEVWDDTFTRAIIKASFKAIGIVWKKSEACKTAQKSIMDKQRNKKVALGIVTASKKRKREIAIHEKKQADAKKRRVCTAQENEEYNKRLIDGIDVNACCVCVHVVLCDYHIYVPSYNMHSESFGTAPQVCSQCSASKPEKEILETSALSCSWITIPPQFARKYREKSKKKTRPSIFSGRTISAA